jgi:hypothetical protein
MVSGRTFILDEMEFRLVYGDGDRPAEARYDGRVAKTSETRG